MADLLEHVRASQSVLAVFAHPDDETLGAGGTIARLTAMGCEVRVLCISDGAQARDRVFERVMGFLGTTGSVLTHPTNGVTIDGDLVSDLDHALKAHTPELVITHWPGFLQSQDHAAVHGAVMRAAARARFPSILLQAEPHLPDASFAPDIFVDISDHLDNKLAAAREYHQVLPRKYLEVEAIAGRAHWWARHLANLNATAAEAFKLAYWR